MSANETGPQRLLPWAAALALGGLFVVLIVMWGSVLTAGGDDPLVPPARSPAPRGSPWELVGSLARSGSASPPDKAPEEALVAHGEAALPALERALRLGLRGRESQAFIGSGMSTRWAVVRVLARIAGEESTGLLVRALADHPDNYAMRDANLRAVEQRDLSDEQLELLLVGNPYPKPVLLALRKVGKASRGHRLRPLVERIHDVETAAKQLRNENDYPNAMPRDLWEIRLLSGQVLGRDMLPEMRERARSLVLELRALVDEPGPFGPRPHRDAAVWEGRVGALLTALRDLGQPVQATVRESAKESSAAAGAVLDMARFMVGEAARLDAVVLTLTASPDPSLRHLAVITLAQVKDPLSSPALWKALRDPLRRERQSCIRVPGQDYGFYPIRRLAARALIQMGADDAEVRRRLHEEGAK